MKMVKRLTKVNLMQLKRTMLIIKEPQEILLNTMGMNNTKKKKFTKVKMIGRQERRRLIKENTRMAEVLRGEGTCGRRGKNKVTVTTKSTKITKTKRVLRPLDVLRRTITRTLTTLIASTARALVGLAERREFMIRKITMMAGPAMRTITPTIKRTTRTAIKKSTMRAIKKITMKVILRIIMRTTMRTFKWAMITTLCPVLTI